MVQACMPLRAVCQLATCAASLPTGGSWQYLGKSCSDIVNLRVRCPTTLKETHGKRLALHQASNLACQL